MKIVCINDQDFDSGLLHTARDIRASWQRAQSQWRSLVVEASHAYAAGYVIQNHRGRNKLVRLSR